VTVIAGIDLGGTAINYTFCDIEGRFLLDRLCEFPSHVGDGPDVCLDQITAGLQRASAEAHVDISDVIVAGLATPGPASVSGVLSAAGSTNFAHGGWAGFDLPAHLSKRLRMPVVYVNDGNAAALWGHVAACGAKASSSTTITAVVGTGLGGGLVVNGRLAVGRNGFAGELGHVLIPFERIDGAGGLRPHCNCGRYGDLESICSLTAIERILLPALLPQYPDHELHRASTLRDAARRARSLAAAGDHLSLKIFSIQAHALGLFFDQMINIFDPDALIVGGGIIETTPAFREWFVAEIRGGMPPQRAEQRDIPVMLMPSGDTAGARGAALEALRHFDETSLQLQ
jgi:predicted NBD/HSP70 family sugar kinase